MIWRARRRYWAALGFVVGYQIAPAVLPHLIAGQHLP